MMRAVMFASILAASASAANAQDTSGTPEAGRVFARQVCSPCHAVTVVQASQRVMAIGPDFQTIANTPGMTTTALRAFLSHPHGAMPDLSLTRAEIDDLVGYIETLR